MAKEYWLKFGSGNASLTTGLSPTFVIFNSWTGGAITAPGITQPITGFGFYRFEYSPSFSIVFQCDGATTGLINADRFITGSLDPAAAIDERVNDILADIGTTASTFGTTAVDPGTLYGYLKRLQELLEGDATFNKTTGVWDIYSRGSSTLLREKTLTNTSGNAGKT